MNTWGDHDAHGYRPRSPESDAYRQAMRDLLTALRDAGVDDVPDEAWARWTTPANWVEA